MFAAGRNTSASSLALRAHEDYHDATTTRRELTQGVPLLGSRRAIRRKCQSTRIADEQAVPSPRVETRHCLSVSGLLGASRSTDRQTVAHNCAPGTGVVPALDAVDGTRADWKGSCPPRRCAEASVTTTTERSYLPLKTSARPLALRADHSKLHPQKGTEDPRRIAATPKCAATHTSVSCCVLLRMHCRFGANRKPRSIDHGFDGSHG